MDIAVIKETYNRIKGVVNKTPLATSRTLNQMLDAAVFFKCENFQRTGSFKFRGAFNSITQLTDEAKAKGVVTHSSGNFGQALARAANLVSVPCTVVMPSDSSAVKIEATRSYGARVVLCDNTLQDRTDTADKLIAEHGYSLLHPYDSDTMIAGGGTAVLELINDIGELDMIFCPVGGGGLLSGTSIAAKGLLPEVRVIGCEPKNVDDAYRSFSSGTLIPNTSINTIADGLRTSLCERTFAIIRKYVDRIVTISEAEIVDAMRFLWERLKLVIEPSGAVSLAVLLSRQIPVEKKRIGVILSGGNVDLESFFALYQVESTGFPR
jgi:threonine dehydratase